MLVRATLLTLLALGLARPTMTSLSALLGGGNASAVAIVLDNSASMGMVDQNRIRFDVALGAAQQILSQIREGDQVVLFLTNGPTEGPFKELGKLHRTPDLVQQILNQAAVSYEKADLGSWVEQARKVLVESDAPNKQIYVLTDQQKLSWDGMKKEEKTAGEEQGLSELEKKAKKIPIIIVDTNRQPKPNVAIQGVELEAAIPVAGLPVKATVEVFNAAGFEDKRLVELYIDDTKEAISSELKIAPQGRASFPFLFTFKRGGLHRGEVRLVGEDGSKFDDRRFFTMEVDQGIPVAIVGRKNMRFPTSTTRSMWNRPCRRPGRGQAGPCAPRCSRPRICSPSRLPISRSSIA